MDGKGVFGTSFSDHRECNNAGVFSQYQKEQHPSQSSLALAGRHAFPHHATEHSCDRIGWQLYFPHKDMRSSRTTSKHVRCLEKHYTDFKRHYSPSEVERCRSFEFTIPLARTDPFLKDAWPTFEHDLKECPEYTIACIGLAMYRYVSARREPKQWPPSTDRGLPKIYPRMNYFGPVIPIHTIDVRHAGKLMTIRGIITRVGQQYVHATWRTYKCKYCSDTTVLSQFGELWTCSNCNVEGGIECIASSVWNRSDTQRNITVQGMDLTSCSNYVLDVIVPDGIVHTLLPHADVTVTGILKTVSTGKTALKRFLQTICMRTNSANTNDRSPEITFNAIDLQAIREIQSEPVPFKLLVQSICPHVQGMETIKSGLLLALFSTTCDTHVLLAGTECDMARQLLERAVSVSSKGVLVNESSQLIDLAEPLALNNVSLCGIPRIDKLDNLHASERILSGSLSSTQHYTLNNGQEGPARATLIATAFPNHGMFELGKPFLDHFTIPRACLERFALLFQMEDTLVPEDDIVCFNGVRLHPENPSTAKCSVEIPLVRKLKLKPGEHIDPLPLDLMRKYIDYARKHCKPEFTEESTKLLESFFSQMYSMPQWLNMTNGMKVAQIQNMVRARARIDLSAAITPEHVMDTIRIVSRSWYDKYDTDDRKPTVNVDRKASKQGPTKTANVRKFLDALRNYSAQLNKKFFTLNDLRELINEVGVPGMEDEIIESLNMQGYLLKKGAGRYELLV